MPTREGSVLCTVCLSSPGDRSGRDPLGREGRSSSTRNEVLVASGEEAGGGEVKGAGCCGACVNGYMEKPPSPPVAPWSPDCGGSVGLSKESCFRGRVSGMHSRQTTANHAGLGSL